MSAPRAPDEGRRGRGPRGLWRRVFGDRDRLGWWMLPIFVAVGLAGAVLAGSLAVVYQGQQVAALRRETAGARADLATAVEDVEAAAEEALDAIADEVAAVREGLSTALPHDDPTAVGVVHLSVSTTVTTPAPPPPPDEDGQDEGGEDGDGQDEPDDAPPATTTDVVRRASGFVVARSGDDSFIVTTFGLLVDPRDASVPLDVGVTVRTAAGETTGRLHSWDAAADLLLLRVPLRGIEPLEWRPADQELSDGERIVAIGLTPSLGPVRVGGTVAAVDGAGLVTDIPPLELLSGGPIVDSDGRVVAVGSARLSPFGTDPVAVPIRRLCGDLLARCPD